MARGAWAVLVCSWLVTAACGSSSGGSQPAPLVEAGAAGDDVPGQNPRAHIDGAAAGDAARDLDPGGAADEPGGTGPVVEDPCQGISTSGVCVGQSQAKVCVVPTGNGKPTVVTQLCRTFEHCAVDAGTARCVLDASACIPGQTQCKGTSTLRTCGAQGTWVNEACEGECRTSALGGFCAAASTTEAFTGTLEYEMVLPNEDVSDWSSETQFEPAGDVLVLSGDGSEWIDAALVASDGTFSVQVPTTKNGDEQLVFALLHPDTTGSAAQFGVFQPTVKNGEVAVDPSVAGNVWTWTYSLDGATSGDTIQVGVDDGSGAMHFYRRIAQAFAFTTEFYGATPRTLVAWFRFNTAWDCGACFVEAPTEVASLPFDSQLFISAVAENQEYWSDAVLAHEIGHYTMYSFGTSVDEGGQHCLGMPTAPGMAWSEGWATGFSSIIRGTSIYYDKQQGSMFWLDLSSRTALWPWQRPKPAGGLLQDIDENEVAAMLWSLAADSRVGPEAVLAGLQSPSVTVPEFKRGYTRQVWDRGENCQRVSILDTGESAPSFADYLDGLVCAGASTAAVDAATSPKQAYPYPSRAPLCP